MAAVTPLELNNAARCVTVPVPVNAIGVNDVNVCPFKSKEAGRHTTNPFTPDTVAAPLNVTTPDAVSIAVMVAFAGIPFPMTQSPTFNPVVFTPEISAEPVANVAPRPDTEPTVTPAPAPVGNAAPSINETVPARISNTPRNAPALFPKENTPFPSFTNPNPPPDPLSSSTPCGAKNAAVDGRNTAAAPVTFKGVSTPIHPYPPEFNTVVFDPPANVNDRTVEFKSAPRASNVTEALAATTKSFANRPALKNPLADDGTADGANNCAGLIGTNPFPNPAATVSGPEYITLIPVPPAAFWKRP
jgi:hypothetical protein